MNLEQVLASPVTDNQKRLAKKMREKAEQSGRPHRFALGDRVQVRFSFGAIRDGVISRLYGNGCYRVSLDKPGGLDREHYCEPDTVFEPSQDSIFGGG